MPWRYTYIHVHMHVNCQMCILLLVMIIITEIAPFINHYYDKVHVAIPYITVYVYYCIFRPVLVASVWFLASLLVTVLVAKPAMFAVRWTTVRAHQHLPLLTWAAPWHKTSPTCKDVTYRLGFPVKILLATVTSSISAWSWTTMEHSAAWQTSF